MLYGLCISIRNSPLSSYNTPYEKIGNNEPVSIADEVPFEIPDSWEWVRCASLGKIVRGSGIKRTETVDDGLPCVRYGELYTTYNTSFTKTKSFITAELDEKCKHFGYGDILMTLTGENKPDIAKAVAYLGNVPVAAGGDLAYWTCHGMNPLYLVYAMSSPYVISRKVHLATGDIIVHISGDKIGSILLPIPPLEEQERIVARIEEIKTLLSRYNTTEQQLSSLQNSFPDQLKKSILQTAVQGKLVHQDPVDEPASVLLERIRAEKQRLIAEGKIKRDKHESVIFRRDNSHYEKLDGIERCIDDEIPFEIPDTWAWARIKTISTVIVDCPHSTPKYYSEDTGFYSIDTTCINSDGTIQGFRYVDEEAYMSRIARLSPRTGDIVYTREGSIGRAAVLPDVNQVCLGQRVMLLRLSALVDTALYQQVLMSPVVLDPITGKTRGIGAKHINVSDVCNALVPVPPMEEQRRILAALSTVIPILKTI